MMPGRLPSLLEKEQFIHILKLKICATKKRFLPSYSGLSARLSRRFPAGIRSANGIIKGTATIDNRTKGTWD